MGKATLGCVLLCFAGCFSPPPQGAERLARLKAQSEELTAALDGLEERLVGGQALVSHWRELADRHREVSEVTCANQGAHLVAMEEHAERQKEKRRRRWLGARRSFGQGGP